MKMVTVFSYSNRQVHEGMAVVWVIQATPLPGRGGTTGRGTPPPRRRRIKFQNIVNKIVNHSFS